MRDFMKKYDSYIIKLEKVLSGFSNLQPLSIVQISTGLPIEVCEEVYSLSKNINKG
jgi:hypothetical protein